VLTGPRLSHINESGGNDSVAAGMCSLRRAADQPHRFPILARLDLNVGLNSAAFAASGQALMHMPAERFNVRRRDERAQRPHGNFIDTEQFGGGGIATANQAVGQQLDVSDRMVVAEPLVLLGLRTKLRFEPSDTVSKSASLVALELQRRIEQTMRRLRRGQQNGVPRYSRTESCATGRTASPRPYP